jgi:hypothetical protein
MLALIDTDVSDASRRRRSDYRPRIDDRALTVAMMWMRADTSRMHWPIGGAARHVAPSCVRRCVRVWCGAHDVAMVRMGNYTVQSLDRMCACANAQHITV